MLKNLRIGTQIGMGFILIVAVSALIVAYAIGELRTGSESFKTYRSLARASVPSGRVQANMLTASNAAKDVLKTREEKYREIFRTRFENARTFAVEQQTAIVDPARREMSRELGTGTGADAEESSLKHAGVESADPPATELRVLLAEDNEAMPSDCVKRVQPREVHSGAGTLIGLVSRLAVLAQATVIISACKNRG